jgi:ribosomal protein S18 acetylase RimI-like enzyme
VSLVLRRAEPADVGFLFECLAELRGGANYTQQELAEYLERHQLWSHAEFQIWVATASDMPVGMLTCNRFAMPRYLGFGVEVEEVVVHPRAQRRGHATAMIDAWLALVARDPALRKVVVKTDDQQRAGKVYAKSFSVVRTTVYARSLNRL